MSSAATPLQVQPPPPVRITTDSSFVTSEVDGDASQDALAAASATGSGASSPVSPPSEDPAHLGIRSTLTPDSSSSSLPTPQNEPAGGQPAGFDPTRRRSSVQRFFASIFSSSDRRASKDSVSDKHSIERPASPLERSGSSSPHPDGKTSGSPSLSSHSTDNLGRRRPSENDIGPPRRRPSQADIDPRRRPSAMFSAMFTPLSPSGGHDDGHSGGGGFNFFGRRSSAVSTTSSVGDHDGSLSDYKIHGTLGKGKFSVVKSATHIQSGKLCAVKFIDKPPAGTRDAVKAKRAYLQETALLAAARDHPNVLHMFAHFETPSKYIIVTEQLHGGELWDRISKSLFRPLEEHDAAVHALVIASTLAYLHDPDRAIVHRDLKTPNLVYRAKPTTGRDRYDKHWDPRSLVLVDFGISRRWWLQGIEDPPHLTPTEEQLEKEKDGSGSPDSPLVPPDDPDSEGTGIMMTRFCGSPLWMAPEIVRGQGYGREVDMWALGVICYGLLTGIQSPIEGLSAAGSDYTPLMWPREIDYPSPPLSSLASDFLKGLLSWNPKERMTAGMALSHKWITDIVGGDWIRWESMVRKYASGKAAQRMVKAGDGNGNAGGEDGEHNHGYDPEDWKIAEWDDVINSSPTG